MAGRPCTVCRHPKRAEIDEALVAGEPYRGIAKRHKLSPSNVDRHRAHIPQALARRAELVAAADEDEQAETLAEKIRRLEEDSRRLGDTAERDGDVRAALMAIKTQADIIELLHKVAALAAAGEVKSLTVTFRISDVFDPLKATDAH